MDGFKKFIYEVDTPHFGPNDATIDAVKNPNSGTVHSVQTLIPILLNMPPDQRQQTLSKLDLKTQISLLYNAGKYRHQVGGRTLHPDEVTKMLWNNQQVTQ